MTSPSPKPPAARPPLARQGRPADPFALPRARDGQGNRRAAATQPPAAARPESALGGAATGPGEGQGCSRPLGDHPLSSAMSEAELENGVRRILKDLPDVLAYHTHDSRRSTSGFPDWCFCGPGGILFRELKRQREKPTKAQDEWLCALTDAGASAEVWRPEQLLDGTIARELAAISELYSPRRKFPWPAGARRARGGAGT